MKKLTIIIIVQLICFYSLCFSSTVGARFGVRAGINRCILNPGNRSGTGFHVGIDIGLDIPSNFAIDIAPQVKLSKYYAPFWPGTDYEYTNLFIPIVASVKSLSATSFSPYLGIGGAVNVQLNGKMINEPYESWDKIEDLEQDFYFVAIGGIEARLARFRISPELSFNYNLTDSYPHFEDQSVSNYDLSLTIGFSYAL